MIQIWLTDKTQQECESIFLRYMVDCLPFYPFEIYGSASATEVAQYQVSEDRKREIEDGRIAIWGYEKLYRYLYLPRIDSKYPNQEEAKKIPVHQDRLRRLLLGPSGEMTVGKRREELNRIIKVIGKIEDHKQLSSIFQYDKFSKSKEAKYILNLLGMEVCPYCNRMFTVTRKQGTFSKKGIRPQFDHFFPKSLYPYLQVNLYNLL